MKISYIKLINVAGLYVGSNKNEIEINFDNSNNKIVSIIAPNGCGKTVLLSSLHPFSNTTSLDERSTLSYILPNKNGYKEIHYKDDKDYYIIKHYFKASKETHSVKSYFMKNGEELNENGNVTSFNSLIELHMGLTPEMMRLIRIGSNVNSFISLPPARRKEYIGKLIEEIDLYMKIYKKINDDIKVCKTLMQTNANNMYNCHIDDIIVEEDKLIQIKKDITNTEKERDKIIVEKSKINSLIKDNDINELRRKAQEAESSINEINSLQSKISELGLINTEIDELINRRAIIQNEKIDIQSKINSFKIMIDNVYNNIERLQINIKKVTSDNDIQSLTEAIKDIRIYLDNVPKIVKELNCTSISSNEVYEIFMKIKSFNQIGNMLLTLPSRAINVYIKLKMDNENIDSWLKYQSNKRMNSINQDDLKSLIKQAFKDDYIIMPNCDNEYKECPYYRFHETLISVKEKFEEDTYDDETLRSIQIISNNVDSILNDIDKIVDKSIPDSCKDELTEKHLLENLKSKTTLFNETYIQSYLSILKEYELYVNNMNQLKQYEHQLVVYKKAGIDSHLSEIKELESSISSYKNNIDELSKSIVSLNDKLSNIDSQITMLTKYNDGKKYLKIFESTLSSTKKILEPLESANQRNMELEYKLSNITNAINAYRERYRELDNKINEYKRLQEEEKKISKALNNLNIILEATSTKKGIPVIYMKQYLTKIQKLSNDLLSIIYDDRFVLSSFNVTQTTFEVPYIKNNRKVPDIKYASQSELALATMALSFALANNASSKYNILLLDEIDAGLDDSNRQSFLHMLYKQMEILNSEQVFIISHNLNQLANVPMDAICLSEDVQLNKLQNCIYQ